MDTDYIVEMHNITKIFPGTRALHDVTLKVVRGTIHGIVGENGAGKSTLIKILMGLFDQSAGEVIYNGETQKKQSVRGMMDIGLSVINQELSPLMDMTIAENIFLGREPVNKLGLVNHKIMIEKAKELLRDLGLDYDPRKKTSSLNTAGLQMIEICKACSFQAKLIIMDEPTSSLDGNEAETLFAVINKLKERGTTILYISHKLEEILRITDRVTVLRDGEVIGTENTNDLSRNTLIRMMVGKQFFEQFPEMDNKVSDDVVLSIRNLTSNKFQNINLEVRKGEILAIYGLIGSGRSELLESIFGLRRSSGTIELWGEKVDIRNSTRAISCGMGFLTEDRARSGCIMTMSVLMNAIICSMHRFSEKGFLRFGRASKSVNQFKDEFMIKTPSVNTLLVNLSGGNQQKVMLVRWMLSNSEILLIDEPTRGIDVNAKAEIYKLLLSMAKEGKTIVMVTSEIEEALGLSNRIAVLHEGVLKGILDTEQASQEIVLSLATS